MQGSPGKKMSEPKTRAAEVLDDVEARAKDLLKLEGFGNAQAEQIASKFVEMLSDAWGGAVIYVPRGAVYKSRVTAEKIVAEFDGTNHNELALKHRMGVHNVYKILAKDRAQRRIQFADSLGAIALPESKEKS